MKKLLLAFLFSLLFLNLSIADELDKRIDQANKTCKELGFKEGSEKLADCALELFSMDNLEGETQTNIVSSNTTTEAQQYTFTGDAAFGTNKNSKRHNKKVAKYMKMPEEVLCISYINNSGIFKKAKQAARTEAVRTRGIDCNPYMDAAFYDKEERRKAMGKATQELWSDLHQAESDKHKAISENYRALQNSSITCRSRKSGSSIRTTCN